MSSNIVLNRQKLQKVESFFENYKKKLNDKGVKVNKCWEPNKILVKNKNCKINNYTNGINSTFDYLIKSYPKTDTYIPLIPDGDCKQAVLGTFEFLAAYFYYNNEHADNKFILLAAKDWSEELNKKFVTCIFNLFFNMNSCEFPIRLVLPKDVSNLLKADGTPRVTLYELCIILLQSEWFDVYEYPTDIKDEHRILFLKPKIQQSNDFINTSIKEGGKRHRTRKKRTQKAQYQK